MARPQKAPQDRRTQHVNVALSAAEIALIEAKAIKAKTSVTAFVRATALDKRLTVVQSAAPDFATRNEWRRIGVNLNQLVNGLNEALATGMMARFPDPDSIIQICTELRDTVDDVQHQWLIHEPTRLENRP